MDRAINSIFVALALFGVAVNLIGLISLVANTIEMLM